MLVGVSLGMLIAGLAVPFVFGDRTSEPISASTTPSPAADGGHSTANGGDSTPTGQDEEDPTGQDPTGQDEEDVVSTATTVDGEAGGAAGGGAPTDAGPDAGGELLTATDRGVTADTIKLGVLLLDVGSIGRIGIEVPGVTPEQQKEAYEVYLKELNDAGGINGRRVEPVFEAYDIFSFDSMRAACLALTRDAQVFTAVDAGGLYGAPILCFTEENRTPLLMLGTQGIPAGYFDRSGGYLFSAFASGVRGMANLVGELEARGMLKTATIGILEDDGGDPGGHTVREGAVATLERLGRKVVHRARMSADRGAAASQVPVAVQQMRASGVDTVLLLSESLGATQFVQEADSQQWQPRYFAGDWQTMYSDVSTQNMPRSFDGSLVLTATRNNDWRLNRPEPEFDADCRRRWQRATGEELDPSVTAYQTTLRICTIVEMFARGASDAGASLTRERLSDSLQAAGQLPLATLGGGALGKGKFDAADLFRFMTWKYDCRCWMPSSDFSRGRY